MEEIIKLISSISVLIASFAGLMAISKWKTERFEKAKIDSLEKYESSLKEIQKGIENVKTKDIGQALKDYRHDKCHFGSVKLSIYFYNIKSKELDKLKDEFDSLKFSIDEYVSYTGDYAFFNYNYFYSIFSIMRLSLFNIKEREDIEDFKCYGDENDVFEIMLIKHYKNNLKENYDFATDIADFLMVHSPLFVLLEGQDVIKYYDFREKCNLIFLKMIRLEKIYLHSFLFKKIFLRLKIFFLKYQVVGRVFLMSEYSAIIVNIDGKLIKVNLRNKSHEEIEKNNRKGLLIKMLKKQLENIVT